MLGRLGWRGQCSCCNGPKAPKAIRSEEKRWWQREAAAESIPVLLSDGAHAEWNPATMPAGEAMERLLNQARRT